MLFRSDDVYLPGCFEAVAHAMSTMYTAEVVYGDGYLAGMSYRQMTRHVSDRWSRRGLAYGTCILVQPATFIRRRAYEWTAGFNEDNRTCWDAELLSDVAGGLREPRHATRALVVGPSGVPCSPESLDIPVTSLAAFAAGAGGVIAIPDDD